MARNGSASVLCQKLWPTIVSDREVQMKKTLRLVLMFLVVGSGRHHCGRCRSHARHGPGRGDRRHLRRLERRRCQAGDIQCRRGCSACLAASGYRCADPNVIQGKEAIGKWWTMLVADKADFEPVLFPHRREQGQLESRDDWRSTLPTSA